MGAFDHVLVLLSFVYALALTHLLSRIAGLYFARSRVRFSGLWALMAVFAILLVFFSWLDLWPFRSTSSWDLLSIVVQFVYAIELYFLCALAAPEPAGKEAVDLDAFYREEHRPFFALGILVILTAMAGNFTFFRTTDPSAFWNWQLACLPSFPPLILLLSVRARWAQWAGSIAVLIALIAVNTWLVGTLH
jgi:hypothetical protein